MTAADVPVVPRDPEILTEVDVSAGTVHLTVTPAIAAQLAEVWWHAHTHRCEHGGPFIVGRELHTALSQSIELGKAAGVAAEETGLLDPPPFEVNFLPPAPPATTYGMCTACGAVEVTLNHATGTRDLSDIGESATYPTGYGCEACS